MERSFVIAVVGSFSGRPGEAAPRVLPVDRDDFDDVLRALAPRVATDLPFAAEVTLGAWEDFRPDGLVDRVAGLHGVLAARDAVADPARMTELLRKAGVGEEAAAPRQAGAAGVPSDRPSPSGPPPDGASLLDAMLEARQPGSAPPGAPSAGHAAAAGDAVDRRIREIVEASVDRTDYAARDRRRARVDAELGVRVNALLHHAAFRAMESRWTSLRRFVRAVETDESLRVRVVDAGGALADAAAELRADLVVTDRILDASAAGFAALEDLCALAERLGAPVLAGWDAASAPPERLAAEARWKAARATPGARHVGVCAPRILARLPYGRHTDPVDRFAFEEDADPSRPERYCWGSAAFELAAAAAAAWRADGSLARMDRCLEIGGLPQHVARVDGETAACGPVERVLTEPEIDAWKAAGLIPVTGVRGRETARFLSTRALGSGPLFAG